MPSPHTRVLRHRDQQLGTIQWSAKCFCWRKWRRKLKFKLSSWLNRALCGLLCPRYEERRRMKGRIRQSSLILQGRWCQIQRKSNSVYLGLPSFWKCLEHRSQFSNTLKVNYYCIWKFYYTNSKARSQDPSTNSPLLYLVRPPKTQLRTQSSPLSQNPELGPRSHTTGSAQTHHKVLAPRHKWFCFRPIKMI